MFQPQIVDKQYGVWSWRVVGRNGISSQQGVFFFFAWELDIWLKIPYNRNLLAAKYITVAVTLGTGKYDISFYENC